MNSNLARLNPDELVQEFIKVPLDQYQALRYR